MAEKYMRKIQNSKGKRQNKGSSLIITIVFVAVFGLLLAGLAQVTTTQLRVGTQRQEFIQAFEIAEAGLNYYRWHLAHDPEDYYDNNDPGTSPGPYIHSYKDNGGVTIGRFELTITPPGNGSTIVRVRSVGYLLDALTKKRTLEALFGIPSFADNLFLINGAVAFSSTATVSGTIHSNSGIRFDGVTDNFVESAVATYQCLPQHGCNPAQEKPGVWGSGGPQSFFRFPVPAIDFAAVTSDLSELKTLAQAEGFYRGTISQPGYHVTLRTDSTFDLWQVNSIYSSKTIRTQAFLGNFPYPATQLLFFEDDVWVDGTIDGRLTIVAAKLPSGGNPDIIINNNILYAQRDGSDVLGLIAQRNVQVRRNAPDILFIDAVMLAQTGKVFYDVGSGTLKDELHVYGSILSSESPYFKALAANGGVISGYELTFYTFDGNLFFGPPPHFPTTGQYERISFEEIN
ncbi:MAG: pilus assembly PilX N-terminal domain-containing protein [Parcubacteria group bacterium]|nr:pilus assembly PilX N-terminal domain-containing protein [Parcubacteria group bacterium]